jgi:hypothetical protein
MSLKNWWNNQVRETRKNSREYFEGQIELSKNKESLTTNPYYIKLERKIQAENQSSLLKLERRERMDSERALNSPQTVILVKPQQTIGALLFFKRGKG